MTPLTHLTTHLLLLFLLLHSFSSSLILATPPPADPSTPPPPDDGPIYQDPDDGREFFPDIPPEVPPTLSSNTNQKLANTKVYEPPLPEGVPVAVLSIPLTQTDGNKFTAQAYIYPNEDGIAGSFRFAEKYGITAKETIFHISSDLEDSIPNKRSEVKGEIISVDDDGNDVYGETKIVNEGGWVTPEEFSHCGGGKKSKPCSAGKLWKRSNDYKKMEDYAAQVQDLFRALDKKGTDDVFKEKCGVEIGRGWQGVRRQRLKEAKEREEEEVAERRKMDEDEAVAEMEARKAIFEEDWINFKTRLEKEATGFAAIEVDGDGTTTTAATGDKEKERSLITSYLSSDCTSTLSFGKQLRLKSNNVLLIEARCHSLQSHFSLALHAAGTLITQSATYEPWVNGDIRIMAVQLGANSAMELGTTDKALKFYQTVLKFDPDQQMIRSQYKRLKKVLKLLTAIETQISKGYNKAALVIIDELASALRGVDIDSKMFRSKIQLKVCLIRSEMGKYEDALDVCDKAVNTRLEAYENGSSVAKVLLEEAYLVRAEALLLDMDYDEAVSDFRSALQLVNEGEEKFRTLSMKLRSAQQQQEAWNGGKMDHYYNAQRGFPDGKPAERDHSKILGLPVNLEEHSKEVKCKWLKKQFKELVRKFHPDKYKGDPKRAARKFKEVTDAKGVLSKLWDC